MYILCLKCACVLQKTGWSALYFSAERGDVDTTTSLLKAGTYAQLRDKVCYLSFISPSFLLFSLCTLHLSSSHLYKNGLTPLEVAIVKSNEWEEKRQRRQQFDYFSDDDDDDYEERDYEGVIDVLSRYSKEPATLPSHDVSRFTIIMLHSPFFHIILFRTLHLLSKTPHPLTSALQLIRTHFLVPLIVK